MSQEAKVGRNDPCPCGSGKKYKKCCLDHDLAESFIIPPEELSGTPIDEYIQLIPPIALYSQRIIRTDPGGPAYAQTVDDFARRFNPGSPDGVFDSVFMSWQLFDLRLGPANQTIGERFLEDPISRPLNDLGRTRIRELNESYLGFYAVLSKAEDHFVLRELMTGSEIRAESIQDAYESEIEPGLILFVRLVGPPERSLLYTTPTFLESKDEPSLQQVLGKQAELYLELHPEAGVSQARLCRESYKAAFPTWMELLFPKDGAPPPARTRRGRWEPAAEPPHPRLVNRDGDFIRMTKARYTLVDSEKARQELKMMRGFEAHPSGKEWAWLSPQKRGLPRSLGRTVLGRICMTRGQLVLETNSEARADRLQALMEQRLGPAIVFKRRESRSLEDYPSLSSAARARLDKERRELNARPEVQEMLRQSQDDYYLKVWPEAKIPALGGKSPREMIKTESGRRKVLLLLAEMETYPRLNEDSPKMDFDRIRRLLGLPSRRQS